MNRPPLLKETASQTAGPYVHIGLAPKAAGFDIRDELLSFCHSHYCAGLMKLCVIGRDPLDRLEEMTRRSFSAVRNLGRQRPDYRAIPLALPEHTGTVTRIVPVKNHRSMELEWLLPPCHHQFLSRPGKLIAHCLAHEAEGSLAHALKERSLINELRARQQPRGEQLVLGVLAAARADGRRTAAGRRDSLADLRLRGHAAAQPPRAARGLAPRHIRGG